jgi:electron transfer flavoprotein beta subunit
VKIIVLVKQVPDTWGERKLNPTTGWVERDSRDAVVDEINERALEVALAYKDGAKDTEVVVISMGPASATEALRKGLAMGADSAVHVLDSSLAGADLGLTAAVLSAAIASTGFDLVIAGNESTDGRGGVIPAMIAEHLGLPILTALDNPTVSATGVSGDRGIEGATMTAHVALPAVISISEAAPEARFPGFKGIMTAKKKPLTVVTVASLGLDVAASGARSSIVSVAERPARTGGRKVVDDGTAAAELIEFLAAGRLI